MDSIYTTPAQATRTGRRAKKAFTLIETMISASVLTIVSASMLSFVVFMTKSSYNIVNHINLATEARSALDTISRDLVSAVDMTTANSRRLRFFVERPDDSTYQVDYQTRKTNNEYYLRRRDNSSGSWSSWKTLLEKDVMNDVRFSFYNSQDVKVNNSKRDDIKKVNVFMDMESSTSNSNTGDMTQSATIYSARFVLRNRATPGG